MIQLLFTVLTAEVAMALSLLFKTPLRKLAILALDRLKRGRGPVMVKTVAGTVLVVLSSSLYSMAQIRNRSDELGLTPTDQVLMSRHLLEASLMGYSLFLALIIDRLHHYVRELRGLRKSMEAVMKQNRSLEEAKGGGSDEIKTRDTEIASLNQQVKRLKFETQEPPSSVLCASSHLFSSIAMKPRLAIKHLFLPLFLILIASPLLFFFFSSSLPSFWDDAGSWKAPLRVMDLLPLLPRRVAWPLLRSLRSAVDLLPTFVGAASSPEADLQWKGACFYKNTAWMEFHNKSKSQFGGGTIHIKTSNAHSWTCMDLYVFATPYRVTWDYYLLSREHTLDFHEWDGEAEYEYVKNHGVSIFLMESGMLGTLQALWDVFPLFTNTGWGESSNLAFLEKHMGATFEQRPQPWISTINVDDIHSGDFLVISKIRGRWGGFETLEKWVSGSYAGHSAVCLKDSEGKLWVGESGHENEKGEDIIVILPWEEWWEFELTKDDSNPHIALLPLHPDMRAKFNNTAAWEYAESMSNKPYGYHNMIFSWIDTTSGNYPPPLDSHVVASVMTMWNKIQPDYAANMWNEALNKRLGTEGLDLPEIIVEAENNGTSFDELLTIPEQDDWIYSDGKSTSCIAFILELYKAAGLFDPIANSIQVTEFTIKDAYTLNFFESNSSRLPQWCNRYDNVKLPYCQIKGRYRMELPGYNTMEPYPHMNERCPSLPPDYERTSYC